MQIYGLSVVYLDGAEGRKFSDLAGVLPLFKLLQ